MFSRTCFLAGTALLLGSMSLPAQGLRVPATVDTLPNGLTVIVHEDHSAPIASVNIWYHTGSGFEKVGRTGFAHLFEHLMFMGSEHAPYPQFDRLLEAAGGDNNGSTTEDRTNYYENGPVNAVPLMLWLEADRMGWLIPVMDSAKVDAQRDIVKNERRQSYENQPYGKVEDVMPAMLYPKGHPYSWPVIGSMADLSAASLNDVKDFFRKYYAPNNATITIAGDVKRDSVLALARKLFGSIPRGPAIETPVVPAVRLVADTLVNMEDRVQLPRLYYAWHSTKAWGTDDAALEMAARILAGSKSARLTQKLVYETQIASNVSAYQNGMRFDGDFRITVSARPGHGLGEIQGIVDAELRRLAEQGPTARELDLAKNATEAGFLSSIQTVGGKANQLNAYYYQLGTPDGFQKDLDRYRAVTIADIQRVVGQYLLGPRVIIGVVPNGKLASDLIARPRITP